MGRATPSFAIRCGFPISRAGETTWGKAAAKLTAGYGSRRNPAEAGDKIGPEFTFGIYMQKTLKEPILIIKTAWGGKSIHTDFRPAFGRSLPVWRAGA